MERMEDERLTERVYRSEMSGVGKPSRPRKRWNHGVRGYMSEGALGWNEGVTLWKQVGLEGLLSWPPWVKAWYR